MAKIKHINNTTAAATTATTAATTAATAAAATTAKAEQQQADISERIQLIAMSATVGNLRELARFLCAELFTDAWRPVRLEEFVKVGRDVYQVPVPVWCDKQCKNSSV